MQIQIERRSGSDRRQHHPSVAGGYGSDARWNGISFDPTTDGDGTYDPYDPYWEPVKGQDED